MASRCTIARLLIALLPASAILALFPARSAHADVPRFYRQIVSNNTTTSVNVDDLTVTFSPTIKQAQFTVVPNNAVYKGVINQGATTSTATFNFAATPLKPIAQGKLDWERSAFFNQIQSLVITDNTRTFFTIGGNREVTPQFIERAGVAITAIGGAPKSIQATATTQAEMVFTNDDAFPITFSSITLWKDNDLNNFTIDNFAMPTGTMMSLPDPVTVQPGSVSDPIPIGLVSFDAYQYVQANADMSGPNPVSVVFGAAIQLVPEPSSVCLLALGLLGLGGYYWHTWRRTASLAGGL